MESLVRPRPLRKAVAAYAGTLVLTLLLLAGGLRLWRADPRMPLAYDADSLATQAWVKALVDNPWYLHNAYLGMPDGADLYDFPSADNLHLGILKLLALVLRDYALIYNCYYLLTYPLTALITLYVFRHFGLAYAPAIVGSLLFTFLPYHFLRGEWHLFLASYYLLPLLVMVILWVGGDEGPLFFRGGQKGRALAAVVICLLTASAGVYYAFFGCYLLGIAALYAGLRAVGEKGDSPPFARGLSPFFPTAPSRHRLHPLGDAAILIAVTSLGLLGNIAPCLVYKYYHGPNPAAVLRLPAWTELLALRISQLLLPITGHRIPFLANLKDQYNLGVGFLVNENDMASLGLVGSCGFLFLIGYLLARRAADERGLWDRLSVLNVFAVLLATLGGFGALFAVVVSAWIRCYNRMSIFVGFFALFAVALLLDRLGRRWTSPRGTRLFHAVCGLVLVVGLLDQTSRNYVPDYPVLKEEFAADAAFIQDIEASLPPRAQVFQLPYCEYPEGPYLIQRMKIYDHFRAYLHSHELRWSYGAMKGREADAWQKQVADLPIERLVPALAEAGFSGIYLDRFGYADLGAEYESKLAGLLGRPPLVSRTGRFSFFALGAYDRRLPRLAVLRH